MSFDQATQPKITVQDDFRIASPDDKITRFPVIRGDKSKTSDEIARERLEAGEEKIARKIINAKNPVIFIGRDMAKSMAGLSSHMFQTFPDTPVVFEDKDTERTFKKARFCDHKTTERVTLGHFTDAASNNTCNHVSGCDLVICFGRPTQDVRDTFAGADFVEQKPGQFTNRINFAVINNMRAKPQ